jgi:hypothetical protein
VPISAGVAGTPSAGAVLASATTGCSPASDVRNPNATGGTTEWIFSSVQASGSNKACGGAGCIMNFSVQPWQASHAYTVGQKVVDTHFQVQMVTVAGTSGGSTPTWNTNAGATTADGGVTWLSLGATTAFTPGVWIRLHHYAVGSTILDSNGKLQIVTNSNGVGNSGVANLRGVLSWGNHGRRCLDLDECRDNFGCGPCCEWRYERSHH